MRVSEEKIHRSQNGVFGGVAAGLATHFDIDPAIMRIVCVVLALLTAGAIIPLYIALWLIFPEEEETWEPVDIDPSMYGATCPIRPIDAASKRSRRRTLVICVCLAVGLLLVSLASVAVLAQFDASFGLVQIPAAFAMAVGSARSVIPGKHGYSIVTCAEGAMLFFVGLLVMLWSVDLVSIRLDAWFAETWPLLAITLGLLIQARALDAPALVVCAIAAFVVFCAIGFTTYTLIGTHEGLWQPLQFRDDVLAPLDWWGRA